VRSTEQATSNIQAAIRRAARRVEKAGGTHLRFDQLPNGWRAACNLALGRTTHRLAVSGYLTPVRATEALADLVEQRRAQWAAPRQYGKQRAKR
jgi:hypothetical protein